MLIALSALGILYSGFTVVGQAVTPAFDYCFTVEGPPAPIEETSNAQFQRDFALLPLGYGCSWVMPNDSVRFEPSSDLLPSVLTYGGLLVGFVGVMTLISGRDVRAIQHARNGSD